MIMTRGKQFEKQIKTALSLVNGVSIDRFPDPMAGYTGIRNICDFGVYSVPYYYYLECKETKANTLNFAAAITKDQWEGLLEKSAYPGIAAGYVVWFLEHDITAFVPALELKSLRDIGRKSLNVSDIKEDRVIFIPVPGRKKRILFEYDGAAFIEDLYDYSYQRWGVR